VDLLLLLDTAQIQRTTTNLQARLQELLALFKLVGPQKSAAKPEGEQAKPAPGE
jgi:hypothetical protein